MLSSTHCICKFYLVRGPFSSTQEHLQFYHPLHQGLQYFAKRNETKRNGTLRNGTLRNGTLRNGTLRFLRNGTLRNGTLRNGYNTMLHHTLSRVPRIPLKAEDL